MSTLLILSVIVSSWAVTEHPQGFLQSDISYSSEIVSTVMSDTNDGTLQPTEGYYVINEMMKEGQIDSEDAEPALQELDSILDGTIGDYDKVPEQLEEEATGTANPAAALYNIEETITEGTVPPEDGEPALQEISELLVTNEESASAFSEETVNWIMTDIHAGTADPLDAVYNIEDMMAEGTILPEDGEPAIQELNAMIPSN